MASHFLSPSFKRAPRLTRQRSGVFGERPGQAPASRVFRQFSPARSWRANILGKRRTPVQLFFLARKVHPRRVRARSRGRVSWRFSLKSRGFPETRDAGDREAGRYGKTGNDAAPRARARKPLSLTPRHRPRPASLARAKLRRSALSRESSLRMALRHPRDESRYRYAAQTPRMPEAPGESDSKEGIEPNGLRSSSISNRSCSGTAITA